jgi:hypothetical protein
MANFSVWRFLFLLVV